MHDVDRWAVPDLPFVQEVLNATELRWWFAGGIALDLFLGHDTRLHHDVDIAILDRDAEAFRDALAGWEVAGATGWEGDPQSSLRVLAPWTIGQPRPAETNAFWCRPHGSAAWVFELLPNSSSGELWRFKRDRSIVRPIESIGERTREKVPYLAPEIVLLHKATSPDFDAQDTLDLQATWPSMVDIQREWLAKSLEHLQPNHEWLTGGAVGR